MDFSEKWGKDVKIATDLALKELKLTIDEVDVIVLEEPSNGFLGFGSKLAKVRVQKKQEKTDEKVRETRNKIAEKEIENIETERKVVKENVSASSDKNKTNTSLMDNFRPDDLVAVDDHIAITFLKETTEKMGLSLGFKAFVNSESVYINIDGKDAATIIGKRGQTLDAIQYLTSLVVNKSDDKYLRVVLDAKNYRAKREETLRKLAVKLAGKVKKSGRNVKLEPMNPYERMVIHAALQDYKGVDTRSEGEEPYRKVVIELKNN